MYEYERVKLDQLKNGDFIHVLGRDLKVLHSEAAMRGGDFWVFEAAETVKVKNRQPDQAHFEVTSIVSMTTDRNTKVERRKA